MKIKATFVIILAFFAISVNGQTKQNNFEISKSLDVYNSVLRMLNMYYVDEINPSELNESAINAMLNGLDPYTVFIPEEKIEDVKLMTMGEYGGIGATIQYFEGKTQIADPYEGFPAQKAGLISGDIFLEINGIDVTKKKSDEISELLKGTPGTTVTLKMQRYGEKEPIVKEVKREKIKIDNIPYSTVFDNGIGYAVLTQFTKDCAKELKEIFLDMKKNHELKGFILDLRGNGGGLLNEAVEIVNMFVPKGKLVVYQKGKLADQNYKHFTTNEPVDLDIPLVILVNEGSASASEIVSGSIQDFDRGVIVGQRTFGKGLVQNIFPMSYNTQMKVTVAHYYLPSKRCIQEIDYAKRRKGSANDTLSKNDTLGPQFHTANGRIVYEGHGITPDVKLEPEMMSTITTHLYAKNFFFKYANKYQHEHKSLKASPADFTISDEVYQDFMQFVKDEGFTFTTESENVIDDLKKTAKIEGYLEEIEPYLNDVKTRIKEEKEKDLINNRAEIEELIKDEIVGRYYYQKGRIISALQYDTELERAFNVILNHEYEKILNHE